MSDSSACEKCDFRKLSQELENISDIDYESQTSRATCEGNQVWWTQPKLEWSWDDLHFSGGSLIPPS